MSWGNQRSFVGYNIGCNKQSLSLPKLFIFKQKNWPTRQNYFQGQNIAGRRNKIVKIAVWLTWQIAVNKTYAPGVMRVIKGMKTQLLRTSTTSTRVLQNATSSIWCHVCNTFSSSKSVNRNTSGLIHVGSALPSNSKKWMQKQPVTTKWPIERDRHYSSGWSCLLSVLVMTPEALCHKLWLCL